MSNFLLTLFLAFKRKTVILTRRVRPITQNYLQFIIMNRFTIFSVFISFFFLISGCSSIKKTSFQEQAHPPAPDYSLNANWAALPNRPDKADLNPDPIFQDKQSSAEVDVFYIHPTIYRSKKFWNADIRDSVQNYKVDDLAIKNQATVFNGVARVYAPRYRQMTYPGFSVKDTASKWAALAFAYQDVKKAFEFYMQHYNNGRPFIIASHSQGTIHAIRLLKEMIDEKPIQRQFIAGYIIGYKVPQDAFKSIPICDCPDKIGCVVNWNSYLQGKESPWQEWYKNSVEVNPVSWKTDTIRTDANAHIGLVWRDYRFYPDRKLSTQNHGGILWVQNPIKLPLKKNFHVGDYNLFWGNIRENAELRVKTYLNSKK